MVSNSLAQTTHGIGDLKSTTFKITRSAGQPRIGKNISVSRSRGGYLASSSDPITGTSLNIGWHAVNVSANDVATSGMIPDTLTVVVLLTEETKENQIGRIITEIDRTASGLGIIVSGVQSVVMPGLKRPIVVVTALGSGDKFVTSSDAKQFDSILMTKTAGIEGTSILSHVTRMERFSASVIRRGRSLIKEISVIEEARTAFNTRKIHAMHDVTEGGIVGAVYEMSVASGLGFEINSDSIPIDHSTVEICSKFSIDPLRLIGSGSLLISCPPENSGTIIKALASKKIRCTSIGTFLPKRRGRWICDSNKRLKVEESSIQDEIWNALDEYGKLS